MIMSSGKLAKAYTIGQSRYTLCDAPHESESFKGGWSACWIHVLIDLVHATVVLRDREQPDAILPVSGSYEHCYLRSCVLASSLVKPHFLHCYVHGNYYQPWVPFRMRHFRSVSLSRLRKHSEPICLLTRHSPGKQQVNSLHDPFVAGIPKVELHVHIEGTLTPELRFKLGQHNNIPLHSKRLNRTFTTLDGLKEMYNLLQPRSIKGANQVSAFFDAYYGGMEVLRTPEDFYELAMDYFGKAAKMNVRYCEPFFDPQAHTRRGVKFETFMEGFKRAQVDAERDFNVCHPRFWVSHHADNERLNRSGSCACCAT